MSAVPMTHPAGRRLAWLLDALSGRVPFEPAAAAPELAASMRETVPPEQFVAALLDVADDLGELVLERVDEVSPYEMAARVVGADLRLWVVRVLVEQVAPYGITSASVSPARVPTEAGCSVPVPWRAVSGATTVSAEPLVHTTLDASTAAAVGAVLGDTRERLRQPALLAAVTVDGETVLTWAGGFAEVATLRRPGRRNAVRACGLSPTVTALTVLSLADQGLIGLEDPVQDHLRTVGLAGRADPARVRDLLRHTTGLLPQAATVTGVRTGSRIPTLAELYAPTLVAEHPRGGPAVLADENTALAGLLVEDVTGRPLADEAIDRVLDPLGMTHSSLALDARAGKAPVCGYEVDFDEVAVAAGSEVVLDAAYGLVSTLEDLARLGAALAGDLGRRLGADPAPTGLPGVGGGLGVFTASPDDTLPVLWQAGGWPGSITSLWASPDARVSVVLVGNAFTRPRLDELSGAGARLLTLVAGARLAVA